MEADLARFYGIDYRDRWRFDDDGRRRLTLRQVFVRVVHLPPESAVMSILRAGKPHWSVEAHLLDDLRMVWTDSKKARAKPHPSRPRPTRRSTPEREKKLRDARRRAKARRRAIESGELR